MAVENHLKGIRTPRTAWGFGEGVKLIQQLISHPEQPILPWEEAFWKKWES
jgi:hypothetical protein